jgi:hypothetical protein
MRSELRCFDVKPTESDEKDGSTNFSQHADFFYVEKRERENRNVWIQRPVVDSPACCSSHGASPSLTHGFYLEFKEVPRIGNVQCSDTEQLGLSAPGNTSFSGDERSARKSNTAGG